MFIIIFGICVSLAFSAALVWYLLQFMSDGFGRKDQQTLSFIIIGAILIGGLNFAAIYFGWAAYFVVMAALFAVAQVLMLETKSKLAFYLLIAGQIPAALSTIVHNVQDGQWNWLNWIFALLLFPLIEIAAYKLVSFISAESDKSQKPKS